MAVVMVRKSGNTWTAYKQDKETRQLVSDVTYIWWSGLSQGWKVSMCLRDRKNNNNWMTADHPNVVHVPCSHQPRCKDTSGSVIPFRTWVFITETQEHRTSNSCMGRSSTQDWLWRHSRHCRGRRDQIPLHKQKNKDWKTHILLELQAIWSYFSGMRITTFLRSTDQVLDPHSSAVSMTQQNPNPCWVMPRRLSQR